VILILGGGAIAEKGIVPVVGGYVIGPDGFDITSPYLVNEALSRGKVDTVVVTAGVSHPHSVEDSVPNHWWYEIEVNLRGAYNVAKASIAHDVRTMIFIASVAGLYGKPNHSGYSASKGGVISLVQSLGMEGHNAYAVSPGRVDTPMRERDYPGEDPRTRLQPEQVGQVVAQILNGEFEPGDNIIIRKIGYDTFQRVDRGEPWRSYLAVGQPVVF